MLHESLTKVPPKSLLWVIKNIVDILHPLHFCFKTVVNLDTKQNADFLIYLLLCALAWICALQGLLFAIVFYPSVVVYIFLSRVVFCCCKAIILSTTHFFFATEMPKHNAAVEISVIVSQLSLTNGHA